ncbi:hypothetical protein GMMP13_80008 [Candidatus Magnetomoraceae bacterium gMMP-13]
MNYIIVLFFFMTLSMSTVFPGFSYAQHGHGEESPQVLESVTVIAEKLTEYVKNHPQNVIMLDREEIEKRNFLDVDEALNSMSGVDVKESGSGTGARISIRGSGGCIKV